MLKSEVDILGRIGMRPRIYDYLGIVVSNLEILNLFDFLPPFQSIFRISAFFGRKSSRKSKKIKIYTI